MSRRARVVDLLTAMGWTMRRRGDDRRASAYLRAARSVARRMDFDELLDAGRLRSVAGVGPSIEKSILEFVRTEEWPAWVEARPDGPTGAADALDADRVQRFAAAPLDGAPDLHVHTTWSDGTLTVDEVAAVAERLGASSVGISDHSGSLVIARGLSPPEVRAQWEDIARVQEAHPHLLILRGTECDILRDGRLDHPREILEGFDYVIGSLHSHLRLPEREQTERVLAALDQPFLTALGHPTTRMVRKRPPAALDLDAVFAKAAEVGVALEVNGSARRLDLNAEQARKALRAGARLSLGSDGHSADEMLHYATARETAARAGAEAGDVVNFDVLRRAARRVRSELAA